VEMALEIAGRQMSGEDFMEYHALIDRGILPERVVYEWTRKNTSLKSASFLLETDISNFRALYPTHENGPEWKRVVLSPIMEAGLLTELLRSPSAKAFADKLMLRDLLEIELPRGELARLVGNKRDEIRVMRAKEAEAAAMSETLLVKKRSLQSERGGSPRMRKIDRPENEVIEDGENFDGDPALLTIRQLFDVHESAKYKRFVKEIGAGRRVFGRDSIRGIIEWAESAKVTTETMIMVAPFIGDTKIFQGTAPLKYDNAWRSIANVDVPPTRGTSHKALEYTRNDARVAQFYLQKGWNGLPLDVFRKINQEYVLDEKALKSVTENRRSFKKSDS